MTSSIAFVPLVAVNAIELYALQTAAADSANRLHGDGTLWAQLVIFLTTLLTLLYQVYVRHADWKEKKQQREWDLEDRRLAREDQARRTEEAAEKVKAELDKQTRVVVQHHQEIRDAVSENTEITAAAAVKAVEVDRKLADIRAMFEGDASKKLDRIEDNTEETVDRLREQDDRTDDSSGRGNSKG